MVCRHLRHSKPSIMRRCAGTLLVALFMLCHAGMASADSRLAEFAARVTPQEVFPGRRVSVIRRANRPFSRRMPPTSCWATSI